MTTAPKVVSRTRSGDHEVFGFDDGNRVTLMLASEPLARDLLAQQRRRVIAFETMTGERDPRDVALDEIAEALAGGSTYTAVALPVRAILERVGR